MRKLILCFSCFLVFAECARCQSTITFDDLNARGFTIQMPPTYVPNGYQGYNWNNFGVINTSGFPASGILNGTVSGQNVASSAVLSSVPQTATLSSTQPFLIVSGFFTSAFLNAMSLEITAFNGMSKVFDETVTLNVTGPSFLTFPDNSVTEVDFLASGGTLPGPDYLGGGSEFVLDNLTLTPTPEPSSWALIACGASLLGVFNLRQCFTRRTRYPGQRHGIW